MSQKFTPQEWASSTARLNTTAHGGRDDAVTIRTTALEDTRLSTSQLQQTNRNVENKIALRLDEVADRAKLLQETIDDVFAETGHQLAHKDTLERELAAKELPLSISKECLSIRQGRQGIDLVEDVVEIQLKKVPATHVGSVFTTLEQI
jgi:tektin-2